MVSSSLTIGSKERKATTAIIRAGDERRICKNTSRGIGIKKE